MTRTRVLPPVFAVKVCVPVVQRIVAYLLFLQLVTPCLCYCLSCREEHDGIMFSSRCEWEAADLTVISQARPYGIRTGSLWDHSTPSDVDDCCVGTVAKTPSWQ